MSGVPGFWRWAAEHPDDWRRSTSTGAPGRTASSAIASIAPAGGCRRAGSGPASRWRSSPATASASSPPRWPPPRSASATRSSTATSRRREIDYIVHDCGARLVVTDAALAPPSPAPSASSAVVARRRRRARVARRRHRRPAAGPAGPSARPGRSCSTRRGRRAGRRASRARSRRRRPRRPPSGPAYVLRRFGIDPVAAGRRRCAPRDVAALPLGADRQRHPRPPPRPHRHRHAAVRRRRVARADRAPRRHVDARRADDDEALARAPADRERPPTSRRCAG